MSEGKELTWEELQAIEKRRRAILPKVKQPLWKILLSWDGTCVRLLTEDFVLWITLLLYILVRVRVHQGQGYDFDISMSEIAVIGGFLSFFLVFFVVESNNRFHALYTHSMDIVSRVFDIALIAASTLPRENALRLLRYMNAAHAAGYVGLSDTYSYQNFFMPLNKANRFLTDKECSRMEEKNMDVGATCVRELLLWGMIEVENASKEGIIHDRKAGLLREKILGILGSFASLFDYDDHPIALFYMHFICFLSTLYLPLFAVAAALKVGMEDGEISLTEDILGAIIVLLQAIFVSGLRIQGQKFVDPYGDDIVDLSVIQYVNDTAQSSRKVMEHHKPSPLDSATEEALFHEAGPLTDRAHDEQYCQYSLFA